MTVESTWSGSGVADLLGWKLLSEEPGIVRAEFDAKEEFRNPKGPIMGGMLAAMLAAMLDMIISAAIRSSMKPNQTPRATLEMKVNFIDAAESQTPARLVGVGSANA